jgi:phosphoribosyl-ATP pyrophosphohydrolase
MSIEFLNELESVIADRLSQQPESSYTARLAGQGAARVAQKVGEEAVEVVIASVSNDSDELTAEAADLIFHLMILLKLQDLTLVDVVRELERRHR